MSKLKRIDKKSSETAAYTCMCRASSYLESDYASVLRKELKYYGESAIYKRVKKDNEKWAFGIEEGKIESFLNSFSFSLLEHLDSTTIENKYFLLAF